MGSSGGHSPWAETFGGMGAPTPTKDQPRVPVGGVTPARPTAAANAGVFMLHNRYCSALRGSDDQVVRSVAKKTFLQRGVTEVSSTTSSPGLSCSQESRSWGFGLTTWMGNGACLRAESIFIMPATNIKYNATVARGGIQSAGQQVQDVHRWSRLLPTSITGGRDKVGSSIHRL